MKDLDYCKDGNRVKWENKNQFNYKKSEELLDNVNSETLVQVFRAGSVAKIRNNVLGPAFDKVSLAYIKQSWGEVPIFTHLGQTLPIRTFIDRLLQEKQDKEVTINTWYDYCDSSLIDRLLQAKQDKEVTINKWDDLYDSRTTSVVRFLDLYGVVNLRRLDALFGQIPFELFADWSMTFLFMWMGYSVGGLHYDEFDNVLFQVNGTKKVLIFPRKYTDVIDGRHYPRRVTPIGFLSPTVLKEHPWMANIPYYEVDLNPGDAVTIPAYTYHAPLALCHDSISINAFLVPHPKRLDLIPDTKQFTVKKKNPHNLIDFLMCKASSWCYTVTGKPLLRERIYEVF
ncbi:MAG: cupin-like domain-containing protein [Xenococcaceae cyanobacterium]